MFWAWLRVNLTRTAKWLWVGHKTFIFMPKNTNSITIWRTTISIFACKMRHNARQNDNNGFLRKKWSKWSENARDHGKTTPLSAGGPFQSRANMRHVLVWCEPQLKAPILLFYRGKCNQKRKQKCKRQIELFIIFYLNFIWVRKNVMNDVDK